MRVNVFGQLKIRATFFHSHRMKTCSVYVNFFQRTHFIQMLYLTVTSFYSRSLNCFRMECCYCLDLDRINENELDQTKKSERVKNWHWIVKVSMERVNNRQTIESKHHSDKCRLKLYTFVIITHTIYDQNKLPSTAKSRQLKLQPKIAW